jgi:glycosyltransferase involved in cell wall biosynthesis
MRKKILIVTPFHKPNIGGAETFCDDLEIALRKKHDVETCFIDWGRNQKVFKGCGFLQLIDVFPRLFLKFLKYRQKDFDRTIFLGLNAGLVGALLKIENSSLVLLALYNFKNKGIFFKSIAKFIFSRMEKIFVEGKTGKRDILSLGIPEEKIIIFKHWCDQVRFRPFCLSISNNKKSPEVLFVGRPIKEKGIKIVKELEKKMQGKANFKTVEKCPHKLLHEHYQAADILIVPSLYDEGFTKVIVEAASCGCAIITSNNGALPEMVSRFGIICSPNVDDFYRKIIKIIEENRIRGLRMTAYRYALLHFNDKNADVFL